MIPPLRLRRIVVLDRDASCLSGKWLVFLILAVDDIRVLLLVVFATNLVLLFIALVNTLLLRYYGGYFGGNNNGQQQQNNNNNRANYAGLYEQRLVHFKLCPAKTCGHGCSGGGDYVIDMNEYVRTYIEYQQELVEAKCEAVREACNCEDTDDNEVSFFSSMD
jgi:hypothetical protein